MQLHSCVHARLGQPGQPVYAFPYLLWFRSWSGILYVGEHVWALILFFLAAVTDVIDGALARGSSGTSRVGAYLDPIADKCLMSGVFLALGAAKILPWWFVAWCWGATF